MQVTLDEYLFTLYTKNEINARRRRFYSLIKKPTVVFTREYCKQQYRQAKLDMRAMTETIRLMREALNIQQSVWDSSGNTDFIVTADAKIDEILLLKE